MLCVILDIEPPPPGTWDTLLVILWIIGVIGVVLGVALTVKRLKAPDEAKRRILPDPLRTEQVEKIATEKWVSERMSAAERELSRKIDGHQKYVHEKFNKLDTDLQDIKSEGEERGEAAIEQIEEVSKQVHETYTTLATVEEKAENTERIVISMNQKLDRAIEREIPTKRKDH